ncbi:hypothetical protein NP493_228g07008 [Ridgeia piscesae]|uniref:Reverse transcriptase domain-containing protein n=1 Tax=Ridgeia piscesae TaxID=27915 RepID=A0AAD9P070_RIDPI|nr:hypothetical protein NP493_228g07008 [Ridgeia piscesae]
MLKILLNRLKPQAEKIIAEEQAGFRPGRSTTEQIFNLRILCEKYLQHQQDLCHVFIDFKNAFERVWHAALWATMRHFNINVNLIRMIQNLYEKATRGLATAALAKLKTIWNDRNIALSSKIRLMRSLVMSIFLYACESWTLTTDTERRIQAMEMRCLRKLLSITYRDHISNKEVRNRTRQAIGPHEDLLTTVKRRKLKWYGHITRSTGLANTILQGTVQGGRRRGRPKKRWEDNIPEWTGMTLSAAMRKTERREEWRELVARSSVAPQRSTKTTG